jgi:hypothetical protein
VCACAVASIKCWVCGFLPSPPLPVLRPLQKICLWPMVRARTPVIDACVCECFSYVLHLMWSHICVLWTRVLMASIQSFFRTLFHRRLKALKSRLVTKDVGRFWKLGSKNSLPSLSFPSPPLPSPSPPPLPLPLFPFPWWRALASLKNFLGHRCS